MDQKTGELQVKLVEAAIALTEEAVRRATKEGSEFTRSTEDGVGWMLRLSLDILAEAKRPVNATGVVYDKISISGGPEARAEFEGRLRQFLEEALTD